MVRAIGPPKATVLTAFPAGPALAESVVMKITLLVASLALVACSGHAVEVLTDDEGTSTDETKSTTPASAPAPAPASPAPESKPNDPAPTPTETTPPPSSVPPCDAPNVAVICQNGVCACGAGPKAGQACGDQQTCKRICAYCN